LKQPAGHEDGNIVTSEAEQPRSFLGGKTPWEPGQIQELDAVPFVTAPDQGGKFGRSEYDVF
jgi:hypothetical protein